MADPRHQLGHDAEAVVAGWLASSGWRLLGRRVRSAAGGEVDLVALDPARVLVALEVRARRTERAGTGTESIDARRVARIGKTLVAVARDQRIAHAGLRVDVVSATPEPGGAPSRWRLRRYPGAGGW